MFQFQIGTSELIFWSEVFLIRNLTELKLKYIWGAQVGINDGRTEKFFKSVKFFLIIALK